MKSLSLTATIFILFGIMFTACQPQSQNNLAPDTKKVSMEKPESAEVPPVSQRINQVQKIIQKMPEDGMENVHQLFPNLNRVQSLDKADPKNLSAGISQESWMYSSTDDVTVVVCEMMNTPAYIFRGKTMTDEQLKEAKEEVQALMAQMETGANKNPTPQEIDSSAQAQYIDYLSTRQKPKRTQ